MNSLKNKILGITLILLTLPLIGFGQQESMELFSIPLSDPAARGSLKVQQLAGSIKVSAYDGDEVIVKASFGNKKAHYTDKKEKEGLKRIENASLSISAEEKDNEVRIINEEWNRATNLEIKVPVNFDLKLSTVNQGNIEVTGVNGNLEISNVNGEVTMNDVGGAASVDTVNGDITVSFGRVDGNTPMAFSSLNGTLDITFPPGLKSNIRMKSDMGEIYTDFELSLAKNQPVKDEKQSGGVYKVKVEQWVSGTINGGGPELLLKTFNGDIMLRKK